MVGHMFRGSNEPLTIKSYRPQRHEVLSAKPNLNQMIQIFFFFVCVCVLQIVSLLLNKGPPQHHTQPRDSISNDGVAIALSRSVRRAEAQFGALDCAII